MASLISIKGEIKEEGTFVAIFLSVCAGPVTHCLVKKYTEQSPKKSTSSFTFNISQNFTFWMLNGRRVVFLFGTVLICTYHIADLQGMAVSHMLLNVYFLLLSYYRDLL